MRHVPISIVLAALLAPAALAADPAGPRIGDVTYRASIRDGVQGPDSDTYVARFAAGERLSVTVTAPAASSLYPKIEVLDPDGATADVPVTSRSFGRRLSVRSWVVPATGLWTVRISSEFGSQGNYVAEFDVKRAVPVRASVPGDVSGSPSALTVAFDALAGSRLDLRATAGRGTVPVLGALTDASGAVVQDDGAPAALAARVHGRFLSLTAEPLGAGDGTYRARFDLPGGHAGLSVTATVSAPRRVSGTHRLSDKEPFLDARLTPHRGTIDRGVRLTGRNLPNNSAATVLFDGIPGTVTQADPFGTFLDVTPPELPGRSLASVAVVSSDGQAFTRDDYFYYVPPPRIESMLDSDGRDVRGARPEGGATLTVLGEDFETGIWFTFGSSADVLPVIEDSTRLRVVVPPQPAGVVDLHVHDAYLHDETAPFAFEYKDPPSVFAVPYVPADPPGDGTVWAALAGVGFEDDDVVLVDGAPTATQRVASGSLLFLVPVTSPGGHVITVRDRVGTVVAAPQLTTR